MTSKATIPISRTIRTVFSMGPGTHFDSCDPHG
jgi:hypothetical protein